MLDAHSPTRPLVFAWAILAWLLGTIALRSAAAETATTGGAEAAAAAATLDAAASASAEGWGVADHRLNLFAHQRRSLAWMRCVEAADPVAGGSSVHVEPLAIAGRTFGSAYEVRLPAGGVVGHPPGAGKTRIAAALIAERAADTTLMAPGHLLPHWEEELSVALGRHGAPIMNVDAPADGTRGQELLGYHWEGVLLIGYHAIHSALAAAQDGAIDDDDDDDDDNGGGEPKPAAIRLLGVRLRTARLIIDEPQDIPSAMHSAVIDRLAPLYRTRWCFAARRMPTFARSARFSWGPGAGGWHPQSMSGVVNRPCATSIGIAS